MRKIYRIRCKYDADRGLMNSLGKLDEVFDAVDAIDAINQFKNDWDRAAKEDAWDIEYKHITNIECEYVGAVIE